MASRSRQLAAAVKKPILTPVFTLKGHTKSSPSISYSPDGKRMISGSWDGTARRWDLEADMEIEKLWDAGERELDAVAVSRDGRWVAMGSGYGKLRVCEVETGLMRKYEGYPGRITCIDISSDSTLLARGSYDTVQIWSLDATGRLVAVFKINNWVGAVRFSQDSKKIAVKSNCLEVWDIQTQELDVRLGKTNWFIQSAPVFWTTKDKTIVAAISLTSTASPHTIHEFDASTLETVGTPFKGHTDIIDGLALSFDCALLASGSNDDTIKLWAFESRQLLASFTVSNLHLIIFSPDSRQLAYTERHYSSHSIYLCNTPPEILSSIQPTQQVLQRTGAPIHTPLAHLPHSDAARRRNTTIDWEGALTLGEPPRRTARSNPSGGASKTDGHPGSSHTRPPDMQLPSIDTRWSPTTDIQRQHYDPGFQSLPQDLPYALGGPASTTISPVVARLPLPRRFLPAIGSRLPQSYSQPRELLPSSSHTDTILPVHNDEPDDLPPEAMLQDLSKYITKDGDYPVARGGFGEIWKCTYRNDQRSIKVAVKALLVYAADQLGEAETKKMKRIKHELRICANLQHRNILPVYGYTYGFGPLIALVSPWAENGNLTAYLEREGADLTVLRRFQILRDITAGLQYLHVNHVIHGDFTAPNVLIHGDGTACISDFGLSLMYSEVTSASQASWTSTLKGNTRWMAPELLVLEQEDGPPPRPSEQSDIYSFGGIMLQVLTNKIPYYYLPNDGAIVLCIVRSQKPFRSRYPELPEKYWEFMDQCWSTNPRDRPSTEGADGVIKNEYYMLSTPELFTVQSHGPQEVWYAI